MDELLAAIPARVKSSRFPRKLLQKIDGMPVIWHVWNSAISALGMDNVFICSNDDEILLFFEGMGARTFKTSNLPRNGTERVFEFASASKATEVLNIQADDPTVHKSLIRTIAEFSEWGSPVLTPIFRLKEIEKASNTNLVKVVTEKQGKALYFSRSVIPHSRDGEPLEIWGHVGIYRYTMEALTKYMKIEPSQAETAEHLEQLRFLHGGIGVQTFETSFIPSPIDSPEDLGDQKWTR